MTTSILILYTIVLVALLICYLLESQPYRDFLGVAYMAVAWTILICLANLGTLTIGFMLQGLLFSIILFMIPASILLAFQYISKKSVNYYLNQH